MTYVSFRSLATLPREADSLVQLQYSVNEGTNAIEYYSGFEMTNACGLISQNGMTQDPSQVRSIALMYPDQVLRYGRFCQLCRGGYTNGASVQCSGGRQVSLP